MVFSTKVREIKQVLILEVSLKSSPRIVTFHVRFRLKYDAATSRKRRQRAGIGRLPFRSNPIGRAWQVPPNMGEATRMFWKDHLQPCQSVPYLLLKMAALASRGADALLLIERPTPLGVASGPRRRSLAQVGSGGSSFRDKVRSLSTSPPPSRRAGSS